MTEADKAYMERDKHDPNPADEVFASVKALIAVIAITITAGLLYYFLYQLTYKLG